MSSLIPLAKRFGFSNRARLPGRQLSWRASVWNFLKHLFKFCLFYLMANFLLTNLCFAQSFYRPAVTYTLKVLDGYLVRDVAHSLEIPILALYLSDAQGQLPLIVWSHGGPSNPNGKNTFREWSIALTQAG